MKDKVLVRVVRNHISNSIQAAEIEGMEVTEAGQLVPDQSTAALVIHHPDAIYFGAV